MLQEIQVINPGGIPVFYHSERDKPEQNLHILQASFFTALTQFAEELQNGQVKLVSMEKKSYLLTKASDFIIIFTSADEGPEEMMDYNPRITEAATFLDSKITEYSLDPHSPALEEFDAAMQEFNSFLADQDLITEKSDYSASSFRNEVRSLIFKSIGYEPGKCNIGRAERLRRLTFGLLFFILSLALYAFIILLDLPPWLVFFLAVPNFFGFLGFFQYFYRFCTTNAMNTQYSMV